MRYSRIQQSLKVKVLEPYGRALANYRLVG